MDSIENTTELFLLSASSGEGLREVLSRLAEPSHADTTLRDLVNDHFQHLQPHPLRLAIVARDLDDLQTKISRALEKLSAGAKKISDTSGIFYTESPINLSADGPEPKIAFLFPGEGSQYPGMLADLASAFPQVHEILHHCEALGKSSAIDGKSILRFFRPVDTLSENELSEIRIDLTRIDQAMFAIVIADWIMYHIIGQLRIRPDVIAGHSAGELIALMSSGILTGSDEQFAILRDGFQDIGKYKPEGASESKLLAIGKPAKFAAELIDQARAETGKTVEAYVAMKNCPHQSVIVGTKEGVELVETVIAKRGVMCQRLEIEQPYHTPLFAPYLSLLRKMFEPFTFHPVEFPVYSCTTAELFPSDPGQIFELTTAHWESPVEFIQLIENQYRDGVRCLIEVGPRNHLCSFTEDILRGKNDILVVPSNLERTAGITQIQHLVAQLFVHGFEVDPAILFDSEIPHEEVGLDTRAEILAAHLRLMEEFLGVQEEVMTRYLASRAPKVPRNAGSPSDLPMIDEIIEFEPGVRIVTRRSMVIDEDMFSSQHTVGGRELSQVDPDQHGLPIVPMTFSIEMLAESAQILCPGLVVTAMSKVRLYKGLDYSTTDLSTAQVSAEVNCNKSTDDIVIVEAGLYQWKDGETIDLKRPAATAFLEMRSHFPLAPPAAPFEVIDERPCEITIPQLYQNLFHGEEYQGVVELLKIGDDGIEAEIEVLPRSRLLRSNPDPRFVFDPVLLDMALHPMCAWHLDQDDQSGRIFLPIGVDQIDFFGPCPEPGQRFRSRTKLVKESTRQFNQDVELVDQNGNVWCSMKGNLYWRFYLPFRKFNFHGPKNVYMLSEDLEVPSELGSAKILVIPEDLLSPTMQPIGAKVTLSDTEYGEFQKLDLPAERRTQWLFGRITAKEAVRTRWAAMTGEMLFTADVEIHHDKSGRPFAMMRGRETPSDFPHLSLSHCGTTIIAIASGHPQIGIDIETIVPREKSFLDIAFCANELSILNRIDSGRQEWVARFWCAKEAVGKAFGRGLEHGPRSVEVVHADPDSGILQIKLNRTMLKTYPGYTDQVIVIHTKQSGGMAIAFTGCETAPVTLVSQSAIH